MKPIVQNTQGGLAVIGEGDTLEVDALLVDQSPVVTADDMAMLSASYAEIKALRDAGKLVPGNVYEITDYETIYAQPVTDLVRSDSTNLFNVRLLAIGPDRFTPEAWAAPTDRTQPARSVMDLILATPNIGQWRLLYDIDNDVDKYAWATPTGKGVIYRMVDHLNNSLPYDFYNVKFRRYKVTAATTTGLIGKYVSPTLTRSNFTIDGDDYQDYLTFDFAGYQNLIFNNLVAEYMTPSATQKKRNLSNCTFGGLCQNNTLGEQCNGNVFVATCNNNTFGGGCYNNIFGGPCGNNTFGGGCNNNTVGGQCSNNAVGEGCTGNSFTDGYGCNIGSWCSSLTFSGVLRRVVIGPVVQNKDFTGFDIYNKTYNQTIQINSSGSAVSRWLNASNVEQFLTLI